VTRRGKREAQSKKTGHDASEKREGDVAIAQMKEEGKKPSAEAKKWGLFRRSYVSVRKEGSRI